MIDSLPTAKILLGGNDVSAADCQSMPTGQWGDVLYDRLLFHGIFENIARRGFVGSRSPPSPCYFLFFFVAKRIRLGERGRKSHGGRTWDFPRHVAVTWSNHVRFNPLLPPGGRVLFSSWMCLLRQRTLLNLRTVALSCEL
jgi:hypothetical protein